VVADASFTALSAQAAMWRPTSYYQSMTGGGSAFARRSESDREAIQVRLETITSEPGALSPDALQQAV
jgi:hypothetical protein